MQCAPTTRTPSHSAFKSVLVFAEPTVPSRSPVPGDQKHQPRWSESYREMLLLKEVHMHPKPRTALHSVHGGRFLWGLMER